MQGVRKRILALDLLRGFLLAVIIIDHIGRFPNPFELLTGRGILWVSAAEGFFIISGLLVGYLYVDRMRQQPQRTIFKLWKRAILLYGLSIFWTLMFTTVAWAFAGHGGIKLGAWPPNQLNLDFIWQLFSLQYVYGWADFLAYYALFMTIAPFVVWLLSRDLWWLAIVASAIAWLVARQAHFALAWQLLFIIAMIAGAYLPRFEALVATLPQTVRRIMFRSVVSAAAFLLGVSALYVILLPFVLKHQLLSGLHFAAQTLLSLLPAELLAAWFDKNSLSLPRLVLALFIFVAFYIVFRRYELTIHRMTWRALAVLGRQSLFVYCLQAIVIYGLNLWVSTDISVIASTLVTALALVVVYGITYVHSHAHILTWPTHAFRWVKRRSVSASTDDSS